MRLTRILAAAALVLAPSVTFAQSFTGTIVGTVKDSSGAAIPHANVTITSQQTGRQDSVTADVEGRYTSLPLPPGEYRVEASLQGFRSAARSNVVVQIASTVVIDFALEVGELTEAVEVRARRRRCSRPPAAPSARWSTTAASWSCRSTPATSTRSSS